MRRNLLPLLMALTAGASCKSPIEYTGQDYVHLVYEKPGRDHALTIQSNPEPTIIYIEGDGIPWINGGTQPSPDPTPLHPLAYKLYKATPYPAIYITRPCYNRVTDSSCNPSIWTGARYSEKVVLSMAAVIRRYIAENDTHRVILVGYSGGGTLAYLLASRIPEAKGIITIAGNLDIDAWTTLHHYLRLNDSLNPALIASPPSPHLAMIGDRDTNIPFGSLETFFESHPDSQVQHFEKFDHVCCWEKNWPALLDAALAKLKVETRN